MSIIYEIKLQGQLQESWSEWFNCMTITFKLEAGACPVTTIRGPVTDQAALHGLLNKIRDLGLPLLSVNRVANTAHVSPDPDLKTMKDVEAPRSSS